MRTEHCTSERRPDARKNSLAPTGPSSRSILGIVFLLLAATGFPAINPELEENELDALRAKSPVALSVRIDAVDLSGGNPAVQIELDATVISVERAPERLVPGDAITIRYAADYQQQARIWAELEEKARDGWAGASPPPEPRLLFPAQVVNVYLSPTDDPAVFHRFAEADQPENAKGTGRSNPAVAELGKRIRMADHDAAFVPHESGNLVVITTGWAAPPCPEGHLCRAPIQLGIDVLDAAGRLYEVFLRKGHSVQAEGMPVTIELLGTDAEGFVDLSFKAAAKP